MSGKACIVTTLVASMPLLLFASRSEAAARVRPVSEMHGNVVHLADLFSGLDKGQDCALGEGPGPGARLVIGGAQLQAIADQFGVGLEAPIGSTNVVLDRPGASLRAADIIPVLRDALRRLGLSDTAVVRLSDWHDIIVDPGSKVEIGSPTFDPRSGRFEADLLVLLDGLETAEHHVSGDAAALVEVVVAHRTIAPGDIIRADDLAEDERPESNVTANDLTRVSDAIGLEATRTLVIGGPISTGALRRPDAVKRGALVTLRLAANGIALAAEGAAVDRGAFGEQVRVLNPVSGALLVGTVSGMNEVTVDPTNVPIAAAGSGPMSLAALGLTRPPNLALSPPNAFGGAP